MIHIPFCPRCNTSLENYMQFCWNCGTKQGGGQTFGPQQQRPQVGTVQQPSPQQQGFYQQGYSVQGQQPYQQTGTMTYGNPQMAMSQPGMQQRTQTMIPCAFCQGQGHQPMNFNQPCPVCRGAAEVMVMQPYTTCQQCEGSGKQFATMDQVCAACQGRGVIQM